MSLVNRFEALAHGMPNGELCTVPLLMGPNGRIDEVTNGLLLASEIIHDSYTSKESLVLDGIRNYVHGTINGQITESVQVNDSAEINTLTIAPLISSVHGLQYKQIDFTTELLASFLDQWDGMLKAR